MNWLVLLQILGVIGILFFILALVYVIFLKKRDEYMPNIPPKEHFDEFGG